MSVVMAKAGIHRSCGETGLGGPPPCRRQPPPCGPGGPEPGRLQAPRPSRGQHLDLPVLEDAVDAAVEAGPGEHGGDGVGQVQHGLYHRCHALGEGALVRPPRSPTCRHRQQATLRPHPRASTRRERGTHACLLRTDSLREAAWVPWERSLTLSRPGGGDGMGPIQDQGRLSVRCCPSPACSGGLSHACWWRPSSPGEQRPRRGPSLPKSRRLQWDEAPSFLREDGAR